MNSPTLFGSQRMVLAEAIELTVANLAHYAETYSHWAIARNAAKNAAGFEA